MSARRTKRFKYILIILEIYLFIILLNTLKYLTLLKFSLNLKVHDHMISWTNAFLHKMFKWMYNIQFLNSYVYFWTCAAK